MSEDKRQVRTGGNGQQQTQRVAQDDTQALDQQAQEEHQEPDVVLEVPELKIDEIAIEVDDLEAHVAVNARVGNLVQLNVGADAHLGRLKLEIKGVDAKALLRVRLQKVYAILARTLTTLDRNPQVLEKLLAPIGQAVGQLGQGLGQTLPQVGQGLQQTLPHVGQGLEQTLPQVGQGVEQLGGGIGQGVQQLGGGVGAGVQHIGGGVGGAVQEAGGQTKKQMRRQKLKHPLRALRNRFARKGKRDGQQQAARQQQPQPGQPQPQSGHQQPEQAQQQPGQQQAAKQGERPRKH